MGKRGGGFEALRTSGVTQVQGGAGPWTMINMLRLGFSKGGCIGASLSIDNRSKSI